MSHTTTINKPDGAGTSTQSSSPQATQSAAQQSQQQSQQAQQGGRQQPAQQYAREFPNIRAFSDAGVTLRPIFNRMIDGLFQDLPIEAINWQRRLMSMWEPILAFPLDFAALPAVNLRERENGYEVEVAVPGYRKEDIDIEASENRLTIQGRRAGEQREDGSRYRLREVSSGEFARTVSFPESIDVNEVKATLDEGLLKVRATRQNKPTSNKRVPVGD